MSEFDLQDKEVIAMVRRNPNRKVCAEALPPVEFLDDGTVRFARKKFPWKSLISPVSSALLFIAASISFLHGMIAGFNGLDILCILFAIADLFTLGNGVFNN